MQAKTSINNQLWKKKTKEVLHQACQQAKSSQNTQGVYIVYSILIYLRFYKMVDRAAGRLYKDLPEDSWKTLLWRVTFIWRYHKTKLQLYPFADKSLWIFPGANPKEPLAVLNGGSTHTRPKNFVIQLAGLRVVCVNILRRSRWVFGLRTKVF